MQNDDEFLEGCFTDPPATSPVPARAAAGEELEVGDAASPAKEKKSKEKKLGDLLIPAEADGLIGNPGAAVRWLQLGRLRGFQVPVRTQHGEVKVELRFKREDVLNALEKSEMEELSAPPHDASLG